jgi:hypothetical protein
VACPIATHRILHVRIDGVHETSLLLASSLTVPWLTQSVCMPLYRGLGALIADGDFGKVERRMCQLWPTTYLQTLSCIALFAVPVAIATGWPPETMAAYVVLCVLYVAFAQSLIVGIVARRRGLWAMAWVAYTMALLLAPGLWFLPPIAGLISQLVPLRGHIAQMRHPVTLHWADVALDLVRGTLLGAVLWSDKFFFFLRARDRFSVTEVFAALLPAVLAYNYYFVRLAPTFDRAVLAMRTAMEQETYRSLHSKSAVLADTVEASIGRTAFVGASLTVVVTYVFGEYSRHALALVSAVAVASWLFMMTTILCYKLDYIGHKAQAQAISAVHLIGCGAVFALVPVGPGLYLWLIGIELVPFTMSLSSSINNWRAAEYTLFWRNATAW